MKSNKKRKIILAIVGLPGAGKTTAVSYLSNKRLATIRFGKIVDDYIESHNLNHDKKTHKKIWSSLRKKYGNAAFAILNDKQIKETLKERSILIDGLRSWEEYLYLKRNYQEAAIYIIAIFTDKNTRYQRSAKRKHRPGLYGEDRDVNELIGMNMGPTIAFADFLIVNNSSLRAFYDNLDLIYRKISKSKQ